MLCTPLVLTPITLKEARAFVGQHHRHHQAPQGGKFAIGLAWQMDIIGVAIVGRPVSRHLDNGWTAEVVRLCVLDGYKNAASQLYSACWRAAKAMGYQKLITYTLPEESGASLRGAGWKVIGESKGGTWNRKSRPRVDTHPIQSKIKWEAPS